MNNVTHIEFKNAPCGIITATTDQFEKSAFEIDGKTSYMKIFENDKIIYAKYDCNTNTTYEIAHDDLSNFKSNNKSLGLRFYSEKDIEYDSIDENEQKDEEIKIHIILSNKNIIKVK